MKVDLIETEVGVRRCGSKLANVCHGCLPDIDIVTASNHAIISAHLTIALALLGAIMSISTGKREDSMSMFGVAIMSILDLLGSVLVLYRWRYMSQDFSKVQIQKVEVYFSITIAVMMALLGATLLQTSFVKLIIRDPPHQVGVGVVVALYGAISSFFLFIYKMRVGNILQSLVLITDSKCSLCVSLISLAVVMALCLQHRMWWSDGLMGLAVALYVMREAYTSIKTTFKEMKGGVGNDAEGLGLLVGKENETMLTIDTEQEDDDEEDMSFTL